jgi:CHAT domain-containing protein/tetratricopeptide (TPR) repeat protein
MAPSSRGLAFVLTFWVVAWPAASIRTGSPDSGWWGTHEALALRQAARAPTLTGDFAESERIYQHGADLAAERHDRVARAWFLSGVADSRLARFDYRGALNAYLQAKEQAERARDRMSLGAIDFNLSHLYRQTWDLDAALQSAEQARKMVQGLAQVFYRPELLLQLGRLRADATSIPLYKEGIEAARAAAGKDPTQIAVEARGWDLLGEALLTGGNVPGAGQAEQRALVLRQQSARGDLGFSYWLLGALRLREGSFAEAESFTLRAMQEPVGPPRYRLQYQLGRILLEQDRVLEALLVLETAVGQAQRWRVGIAPALPSLDGAIPEPGARIFDGFVEAAANYGIQTHNQRWIAESFQATELNRAINFQGNTQSAWRGALPLEYRETLGKLQAEETRLLQSGARESASSERLEMRLTEMEAQTGLGSSLIKDENFPSNDSLIHFHRRLREFEILLSFGLGERESFLWAVTRNTLHVYRLPPADRIRSTVRDFRQAIEGGRTDAAGRTDVEDIGGRLYTMLFGQLQAQEASKPAWLLSPEDALLQLPFAALVLPDEHSKDEHGNGEPGSGRRVFLAERHSLQVIAGALLPEGPSHRPLNGFLSVGDPIYNFADPRWKSALPAMGRLQWWWASLMGQTGNQLNRLPGSRREVESSAAAWGGGATTRMLQGADATREKFLESLAPPPQVIHLATHALTPASGGEAYLVFGLGPNGRLEMLSTSAVQTLQVPGSVVVMTGCATAPTDVRTGLGLATLVRAWTVAGASAVVATEWAVRDNAGRSLLSSFYRHLQEIPNDVAEALRLAQVEMIHSGAQGGTDGSTTQSAPASWAAYQVFDSHSAATNPGTNPRSGSYAQ